MSIVNFIPTVWSETLYKQLSKTFIAVNHCNRDFEGDIKGKGSSVKICGVGGITISDYTKNTDMSAPQTLSDNLCTLTIDKAKFFNFQIDDVDRVQASPMLMDAALQRAAEALASEADKYVFSLVSQASVKITHTQESGESIFNTILKARETLYKNNVTDGTELFLEVTPKVATTILKEKFALPSTTEGTVESGYLGSIFGCKIYVSTNLAQDVDDTMSDYCILRTRRAIAFADQLSEIEAYRPEKRFADAVKGLHLYGAKVVYPEEMVGITYQYRKGT